MFAPDGNLITTTRFITPAALQQIFRNPRHVEYLSHLSSAIHGNLRNATLLRPSSWPASVPLPALHSSVIGTIRTAISYDGTIQVLSSLPARCPRRELAFPKGSSVIQHPISPNAVILSLALSTSLSLSLSHSLWHRVTSTLTPAKLSSPSWNPQLSSLLLASQDRSCIAAYRCIQSSVPAKCRRDLALQRPVPRRLNLRTRVFIKGNVGPPRRTLSSQLIVLSAYPSTGISCYVGLGPTQSIVAVLRWYRPRRPEPGKTSIASTVAVPQKASKALTPNLPAC